MTSAHAGVFGGQASGGTPVVALNLTALDGHSVQLAVLPVAAYAGPSHEVENKSELLLPSSTSQVRLQLQLTISITQSAIQVADAPWLASPMASCRSRGRGGQDPGCTPSWSAQGEPRPGRGRSRTPRASGILLWLTKTRDSSEWSAGAEDRRGMPDS